jgi:hypothetical protein
VNRRNIPFKVDTLENPISDLVVLSEREREREHLLLISSTSTYLLTIRSGVGGDISSPPLFADGVVGPRRLPSPAGMDWCRHPSRHPQNWYIYTHQLAQTSFFVPFSTFFARFVLICSIFIIVSDLWAGLRRLRQEVITCEYEDVHVMWEMLSRTHTPIALPSRTAGRRRAWPPRDWPHFSFCRSF